MQSLSSHFSLIIRQVNAAQPASPLHLACKSAIISAMYENVREMSFGQFILRLVIFAVGGMLCIGVSYTVLVPQLEPLPLITERDILPVSAADYPVGWRQGETVRTEAWRTENGFVTQFTTGAPVSAVSLVFFLQYETVRDADDIYFRFADQVFIPGLTLTTPDDFSPASAAADQFTARCQFLDEINRDSCAYWAQYGRCLVNFFSQVQRPYMNYRQFQTMVEEVIDPRMAALSVCQPE
jgi:hypothetical protein